MALLASKFNIIVLLLCTTGDAAHILGIFPLPSYSHQIMIRSVMKELAHRGHELVIFTTDPLNDPTLQNYHEIDLHYFYNFSTNFMQLYLKDQLNLWTVINQMYDKNENITNEILSSPIMQRIISPNNTEKFDLIIVQNMIFDAFYALTIRLNAPLITISATPLLSLHHYLVGNPLLMAYSPDISTGFNDNMNLWERFVNVYYYFRYIYVYLTNVIPRYEKIIRKYFGDNMPSIQQLSSNISLHLVNSHPFYEYPRANVPNVILIGRCHLTRQKKKLPQDLQDILDDAKEGYIYFSLGSRLNSNLLPLNIRNMLLKTFAKLPYKVLWKFEPDYENKYDNVVMRKWLPQEEILAHPNLRLYIYQGGLQSTEEVIENGVPVIIIPFFYDQFYNAEKLHQYGAGKKLDINTFNEEEFRNTILEVITNPSYKENMMKLRNLLRDLPYDPMNNTMWWIEHVIRHKGAPHLRSKSLNMPWYQVEMFDIMAIVLGIIILITCIITTIIKRCIFRWQLLKVRIKQD